MFFGPTARFISLVCLVVILWFAARMFQFEMEALRARLTQYPAWLSACIFIGMYVGFTSLLWVGTMDFFRISGALIFGAYWGTLFIWIAEILNAAILFHVSRQLGQEFVLKKLGIPVEKLKYSNHPGGFWSAFVLRINPLVPFRFMDLGFGLSKIDFPKYFWAVVLGSPGRIFMVQFIIAGVGEAILKDPRAMMNYLLDHRTVFLFCAGYLAVVALITFGAIGMAFIKKSPSHQDTSHQ